MEAGVAIIVGVGHLESFRSRVPWMQPRSPGYSVRPKSLPPTISMAGIAGSDVTPPVPRPTVRCVGVSCYPRPVSDEAIASDSGRSASPSALESVEDDVALVEAIGWRYSTGMLAGVALVVIVPVWLLMRNAPADLGLIPYGATTQQAAARSSADPGIMGRALRTPAFWLLASTFFICGATSNGLVGTHLVPHAIEHGIAAGIAAGMLALMGTMNFIGTLTSGWLTDRYDPRLLLACYYGFRGVSLLFLPFVTEPLGLAVFAILFGLDYIATVPPTTALVADSFGRANVGTVFGWIFCAHQIGAALAAWLGGLTREFTGDYGAAFLAAGVLAGIATLLALRIDRERIPVQTARL
ncbi:MFS transporter [Candidatus Gracilibacteria bacterium]|nr:MFS transporter [Candidatus Gracilibacteria bacterium]